MGASLCIEYSVRVCFGIDCPGDNALTNKQAISKAVKYGKRVNAVEFIVIILLSSFILSKPVSSGNISWFIDNLSHLSQGRSWDYGDIKPSFLKRNLVIDWDYYGDTLTCGRKHAVSQGGNGPVFLCPGEKKPYYLFNVDIDYAFLPLRLFRNFTKGDGTSEFAEKHREIKAVVFYQKDLHKVKKIKRKIDKIVWDDFCKNKGGNCKTVGILFFAE